MAKPRGKKPQVEVVRVYEDPGRAPGEHRVLVDRLWPRGVKKAAIDYDEWAKEAAPSTELRRWYGHDPQRFAEFARRYRSEMASPPGASEVDRLRGLSATRRLVLITATRDVERSGAVVLRDVVTGPKAARSKVARSKVTGSRVTGSTVSSEGRSRRMEVSRFGLEVPSPFRLDLTVWVLRRRAHNAIDTWDGTWYRRTVVLGGRPVGLAVRQEPDAGRPRSLLLVEVRTAGSGPDDAELTEARHLLEQTLGLGVGLSGFYALAERDRRLVPIAQRFVGMRPPRLPSVFETLVNAVACQQLSLTVGVHLLNRLACCYGPTLPGRRNTPVGFPTSEALAGADPPHLRILGFSQAKARTLTLLARRVASGDVDLAGLEDLDDKAAVAALTGLPGIGRWSAEYTLLRGLGRWHVLPGDDVGARNNLRRRFGLTADAGYDDVAGLSRTWSPYGGIVYFHLLLDGLDRSGELGDSWGLADVGEPERAREPSLAPAGRRQSGEVA